MNPRALISRIRDAWSRRRWPFVAVAGVIVLSAGLVGARIARSAPELPMADVKRGEFVDSIELRGEVRAQKSIILTAPSNAGDLLIIKLVKNGTMVKAGDAVVEFDTTPLQRTLEQKRTELKQAEAEIEKSQAQQRLQEEQDATELSKCRYDVERARLDTLNVEFISRLDAEKRQLALAAAEQRLKEIGKRMEANGAAAAAEIESKKQKREKALFDVNKAERDIKSMVLRAPSTGMITLMPNWRAGGFFGGSPPEFREGDRAWPGAAILELPDLSTVRVNARIEETDRSRIRVGQEVTVRVDAVPDKELPGRVDNISALAKPDFSGWPPIKNFDLAVKLKESDPRMRPGMSANARIAVDRVPNSLLVPTDAVFQKFGRSVVYVRNGSGFLERQIEVARRSKTQVLVAKGLEVGEQVSLRDPTVEETQRP